jgi:hypothetical protein
VTKKSPTSADRAGRPSWTTTLESPRQREVGGLLALAWVALLPSLFAPFLADDYLHVVVAERLSAALTRGWVLPIDLGGAWWTPHGLSVEYFRPLIVLSFALDRLVYGTHAAGYHLTNLALHATATLLVWAIARRVLGAGFGAWAAAALFAIHPCHVQAVGWISGRTDVLAATLYMAAFLLYLESRRRPRAAAALVGLSLSVFFLALLAKEMAITLPLILLGHNLLRPEGESISRRLVAPALACVVAAIYFALRVRALGGFHTPPAPFAYHFGDPDFFRHLVTAPIVYLGALTLFVPADPMVTIPFWKAHPVLLVLFACIVIAVLLGLLRRVPNRNALVWGLGWTGVTLLPVALLTVGEHFLYLPSLGYCILVGAQFRPGAAHVDGRASRRLAVACSVVAAICLIRTVVLDGVAYSAARTAKEAAATLEAKPDTKLLLLVDLPTAAALVFSVALRFAAAEHSADADVEILSIMPSLTASPADRSLVTFAAPDRLELRRDDGFLTSYVERALAGPHPSFRAGETFQRVGHVVTVLDAPRGRLDAFETRIVDPAHTLVLAESGHGLVALEPER